MLKFNVYSKAIVEIVTCIEVDDTNKTDEECLQIATDIAKQRQIVCPYTDTSVLKLDKWTINHDFATDIHSDFYSLEFIVLDD